MKIPSQLAAFALSAIWFMSSGAYAKPLHSGLDYHRYLQEKDTIRQELAKWKASEAAKAAIENGVYSHTSLKLSGKEDRDQDDEDQLQRFFLSKQAVEELQTQHPDAEFSTDSPFALMTGDEFQQFVKTSFESPDAKRWLSLSFDDVDQDTDYRPNSFGNLTTNSPTSAPTGNATTVPTPAPTGNATTVPTPSPSRKHCKSKTKQPTPAPRPNPSPYTASPSSGPTASPSTSPSPYTASPSSGPTTSPSSSPTAGPTAGPTNRPSSTPTSGPTSRPTNSPSAGPTTAPDYDNNPSGSVDWSKGPCMTPVKMQGGCRSCWAFAAIAAIETHYCHKNGNKLLAFSEQNVVSCDRSNSGCQGGYPAKALSFIQKEGVCVEEDYPYAPGKREGCKADCNKVDIGIKKVTTLDKSEGALANALKQGPVTVAVTASNQAWQLYKSGVLESCSQTRVDHAVLAVGYDGESWKIKNSWGMTWGDAGYIRLKRGNGKSTCGILDIMAYPEL